MASWGHGVGRGSALLVCQLTLRRRLTIGPLRGVSSSACGASSGCESDLLLRPGVEVDTEAAEGTAEGFLAELSRDLAKKWLGELL